MTNKKKKRKDSAPKAPRGESSPSNPAVQRERHQGSNSRPSAPSADEVDALAQMVEELMGLKGGRVEGDHGSNSSSSNSRRNSSSPAEALVTVARVTARLRERLEGLEGRLRDERCLFGKASQVASLREALLELAANPTDPKPRTEIACEVGLTGMTMAASGAGSAPPQPSTCHLGIWRYLRAAETDLDARPQQLSSAEASSRIARLAPPRNFDFALQAYAAQQSVSGTMFRKSGRSASSVFASYSLKSLKEKNPFSAAFKKELKAARLSEVGDEARQLGNREFKHKRLWQAEAAYWLASALDPLNPAPLSNLAHTRTLLGRSLRSEYSGNAKAAVELLEQALRDAQGSTERDPQWLRGYERAAAAAGALGGEHLPAQLKALSATMEVLRKTEQIGNAATKQGIPGPSDAVMREFDASKARLQQDIAHATENLRSWEGIPDTLTGGSIDGGLAAATEQLKKLVATEVNPESGAKLGDEVIAVVKRIQMLLRLTYQDPLKYPPILDKSRLVDLGAELRKCGRVVSLKALESAAFKEDLFESAFWGLHHLDRLGVPRLPRDAPEPDMAKPETDRDKSFTELMKRAGGGHMTMDQLHSTMEIVKGRMDTSDNTDESLTYTHYFHVTVLIRLVRSSLPTKRAAAERIVEYWRTEQGRHVAGELGSRGLLATCGLPKWELPADPQQQLFGLTVTGAVKALALDVVMGGETEEHTIQRFLAELTPVQFRGLSVSDLHGVAWDYALCGLDKNVLHHDTVQTPLVSRILANILESEHGLLERLMGREKSTTDDSFLWKLMRHSAFGQYLSRSFYSHVERKVGADGSPDVPATVLSLVRRWRKKSEAERSGYRWETYDDKEKKSRMNDGRVKPPAPAAAHTANKAPAAAQPAPTAATAPSPSGPLGGLSMEEFAVAAGHPTSSAPIEPGKVFEVPLQVPRCEACGAEGGPGLRLRACAGCQLVHYCCVEHQRKDRKRHKPLCKSAAS